MGAFLPTPTFLNPPLGVFKNRGGPPKSSILIGFSIINHPFWGTPIFGNTIFSQSKKVHVVFFSKCGKMIRKIDLR